MTRWKKGERVAERLQIEGWLASGGMADIYVADLSLPRGLVRRVAVKRIHPHLARDEHFLSMFLDEARLASRLSHPGLVPVHDIIEHGEELLLILDYVPGWDLSSILKRARGAGMNAAPADAALVVALGIARTLAYVHDATNHEGTPLGIVHRDVNPSNILVARDGTTRLLDFGVAKAVERITTTATRSIKGKLAYLAPEQAAAGAVDHRADLYGVGLVLFEMLSGRRALKSQTEVELIQEAREPKHERIRVLRPDVPEALDDILARLLAIEPDGRPPDATALIAALEAIAKPSATASRAWMLEVMGEEARPVETGADALGAALARVAKLDAAGPGTAQLEQRSLGWFGVAEESKTVPTPPPPPPSTVEVAPTKSVGLAVDAAPTIPVGAQRPSAEPVPAASSGAGRWVAGAVVIAAVAGVGWFAANRPSSDPAAATNGFVRISTAPPGATVRVDDRQLDELTPTVVSVTAGSRPTLSLALDDHVAASTVALVVAGETTQVHVALERSPGRLIVKTEPRGAKVRLDGALRGKTPVALEGLARKTWLLSVTLDGHASIERPVDLAKTANVTIDEKLSKSVAYGTLDVSSTPWASVRVGKRLVAESTPATGIRLPVGTHTVRLKSKRLGRTEVRKVRIRRNRRTSLIVEF